MSSRSKLTTAAAVAAVVVAVAVSARADASPRPPGAVEGAAWVAFTDFPSPGQTTFEQFVVSAKLGPDGEPKGTIVQHSEFGDVRAEVTCLVQTDEHTAYVGGRIVSGFEYLGLRVSHLALGIRDNGQGNSPPDLVAGAIYRAREDRPPEFDACTPLLPFPPVYAVQRGNYVVGNGPPVAARVRD